MKKAIFTVMLDDYDYFPRPAVDNPGWDKILFTDKKVIKSVEARWDKVIYIEATRRPDIASRDIKWRSHIHLPEYEMVCYHDANLQIVSNLPDTPFRVEHERRFSVREEADALNKLAHRCTSESVEHQLAHYEEQGFPDDQGLYYGGFFCRYHSLEENEVGELVFDHINRFTSRDQLSFPYAMWKLGFKPEQVVQKPFFNRLIKLRHHKKKHKILGRKPKVHHILPARSDRNFGKAINDIVKGLGDDDWICLRDIDTLPLDHVSFIQQCEEIAEKGEYGLVSCMTNRLGVNKGQLVYGKLQPESEVDMVKEVKKAKEMAKEHWIDMAPDTGEIAGVMMMFPKSVWKDVGGFREGGIIFGRQLLDNVFYTDVKNKGHKIGVVKGIYLFHLYRWGKTRKNKEHLK